MIYFIFFVAIITIKTFHNRSTPFYNIVIISNIIKIFKHYPQNAKNSTIFKTNTDLGITDISLNKNIKGLFSGEFFQKRSVLSDSDVAALAKYNSEIERGVSKNIAFHKTMKDTSVAAQNMARSAKGAAVNISEIPKQSKAAEIGLKALSIAGNMLVSMGVAWGISKIIEGIEWLATSSERAKEAAESLSSELKTQEDNILGNISTLKGLESEFNSLSKGVDDYGANISLSADEYARYQEIVQQIIGISPSLISGYDKEGNAILFTYS